MFKHRFCERSFGEEGGINDWEVRYADPRRGPEELVEDEGRLELDILDGSIGLRQLTRKVYKHKEG